MRNKMVMLPSFALNQKERRPSTSSAMGVHLLAPPSMASSSSLSPHSVADCKAKRRNSYAAGTEATTRNVFPRPLMSTTALSSTSMMSYGTSHHLLDPRVPTNASFRRRLLPTPPEFSNSLAKGPQPQDILLIQEANQTLRRTSSPRVLPPTPPGASQLTDGTFLPSIEPNFMERRKSASTRRRLPAEPVALLFNEQNSVQGNLMENSKSDLVFNNSGLFRSSSTRNPRELASFPPPEARHDKILNHF